MSERQLMKYKLLSHYYRMTDKLRRHRKFLCGFYGHDYVYEKMRPFCRRCGEWKP